MTMVEDVSNGSEEATETDIGRPGVCESPSCVRACSACSTCCCPALRVPEQGGRRELWNIERDELPCERARRCKRRRRTAATRMADDDVQCLG